MSGRQPRIASVNLSSVTFLIFAFTFAAVFGLFALVMVLVVGDVKETVENSNRTVIRLLDAFLQDRDREANPVLVADEMDTPDRMREIIEKAIRRTDAGQYPSPESRPELYEDPFERELGAESQERPFVQFTDKPPRFGWGAPVPTERADTPEPSSWDDVDEGGGIAEPGLRTVDVNGGWG